MKYNVSLGYSNALSLAKEHYENFPVVSLLIPTKLKYHVAMIYWFARAADDLADEGDSCENEKLRKLKDFEYRFSQLLEGHFENDLEAALLSTIKSKSLNPKHFYDLLSAFEQDVAKKRYANYAELLDYCRRSANPVGRLILELYGIKDKKLHEYSDKICTALQLTNFYQDTKIDYEKGRIYLPQDELKNYTIDESVFENDGKNANLRKLLQFNVERTRDLFAEGRSLLTHLRGKLKLEIEWTILGGEKILQKIEKNSFNVFSTHIVLSKSEMVRLFLKTLI